MRRSARFCNATWLLVAFVGCFPWGRDAGGQSSSPQANSPSSFVCPVTTPNGKTYTDEQLAPLRGRMGTTIMTNPDGTKSTFDWPVGNRLGNYGNDALATTLWTEGKVVFRPGGPGFVLEDGPLSMKWGWFRLVRGELTIEGRRLDGPAPPLHSQIPSGYDDIGFQATALIFPTPGCWEVTGRVGEETLTFVTEVVKIGEGPGRTARTMER